MRESKIEKHLVTQIKAQGGLCWKHTSTNLRGVPDRIVMLPGGVLMWVELKAPGKVPRAQQNRRHAELKAVGQQVYVLDSIEAVDAFLRGDL